MKIKAIFTVALALLMGASAMAQSDNVAQGKKWYDLERYDKALPYLTKAVDEGDADSKARLETMIFTMQVPQYSMDRDKALTMLDEAIDAGSVLAMERKGFCTLNMGEDTKEAKLKAIELLDTASKAGSADASFTLFKVYRDGIKTYSNHEVCVAVDESQSLQYIQKCAEQGGLEGKAYVGWYTLEGTNGYEKDEAKGSEQILAAWKENNRIFAGNCLEPGRALVNYLTNNKRTTEAAPIKALLKKFHPTEY